VTEALQLLTVVATAIAFGAWGLNRGRKERQAEKQSEDERQQSIYFPTDQDDTQHRGAAMSHLSR